MHKCYCKLLNGTQNTFLEEYATSNFKVGEAKVERGS